MSFYWLRPLIVKRNDAVADYMNEWAWDLYMECKNLILSVQKFISKQIYY